MKTSGFTFLHNGIEGGYPFVEAIWSIWPYVDEMVIVDMESTDGTREILQKMGVSVLDGVWKKGGAGKTLAAAHSMNSMCGGDIVLHFEADEVFEERTLRRIKLLIETGTKDIAIHRLQISQNLQRVRWYPEPVHRVFPKGSVTKKGHTTNRHREAMVLSPDDGFLWDCTNIFRDTYLQRIKNQAELWGQAQNFQHVGLHAFNSEKLEEWQITQFLSEPHWTWTATPLNIPDVLKPLVGKTRYEVNL